MGGEKVRVTIILSKQLARRLEKLAESQQQDFSQLIEDYLWTGLIQQIPVNLKPNQPELLLPEIIITAESTIPPVNQFLEEWKTDV